MRYEYTIEYIGLQVRVVRSPSKERIGITGTVIDETRNTLLIEKEDGGVVRIPKAGSVFRFAVEGKIFDVDGSKILFRPEERLKKIK